MKDTFALYWMLQLNGIFEAAQRGDLEELEAYKAAGGSVNAWEPLYRISLFQIALLKNQQQFARAIAETEGFNPFHTDAFGRDALNIAHRTGNPQLADLVMETLDLDDAPEI